MKIIASVVCFFALGIQALVSESARPPNILWIVAEDLSPFFGCYDDPVNRGHTPTVDALAAKGVLFKRAYATAPVCSASRSAFITGVMQTTTGTHQHRSSRADDGLVVPEELRINLPKEIKTVPELLSEQGYFTFNSGKDDYNFHYDRRSLYAVGTDVNYLAGMNGWQGNKATHWKSFTKDVWNARKDKRQPWFGQIQVDGGKGDKRYLPQGEYVAGEAVELPPYFPDTPALRDAWVVHYNNARGTDVRIASILAQLEADGELENTIIFFFSDHGHNTSLRHKQFCYEGGLHVPLVVKGEHPAIAPGRVVDDLVTLLDVSASTLALAGVELPEYLDGQNLFGKSYREADFVIGARDRCDYTIDRIRSVRTERFRYIRNYYPDRPLMQPGYRDARPPSIDMRRLFKEGKLSRYQSEHWFGIRPEEELYDMEADPHQMNNLALEPTYRAVLLKHRSILEGWIAATGDRGQLPESDVQLKATYDLWKDKDIFYNASVNPEYDKFK
ncbi:sulfatase [Pelagicoccus enzymogenes]|uniref:sulfatase family protein n=1 Tax=Pelagicoccus enzymogenes TaxID=2773457 RepID=UPI00280E3E86|nr:sulfatase [Pelagicoccus enzymogenes]MDQ8201272.1 sulfatase [Pelagicoccus enzymogenes]